MSCLQYAPLFVEGIFVWIVITVVLITSKVNIMSGNMMKVLGSLIYIYGKQECQSGETKHDVKQIHSGYFLF